MSEERSKINLLVNNLNDNLKDFAAQFQGLADTSERNFVDFSNVMIENLDNVLKIVGVYKDTLTEILLNKDDLSKVENILNEALGND